MARKRKTNLPPHPVPVPAPPVPVWRKPWVWSVGAIAATALLLTNINSILSNARTLPSEIGKTSDQFFNWYGDYSAWKGKWSDFPEGRVDMAELRLTSETFRLDIDETISGALAGSIETKGICDRTPMFDRLLVEGSISSWRHAEVSVFDFIGGHKRVFATLTLRRDGDVMTVIPRDDPSTLFAKESRIALDPDELEASTGKEPICGKKREQFMQRVLQEVQQNTLPGTDSQRL